MTMDSAQHILERILTGSDNEKIHALEQVASLGLDLAFVQEFTQGHGLDTIISIIENEQCAGSHAAFIR